MALMITEKFEIDKLMNEKSMRTAIMCISCYERYIGHDFNSKCKRASIKKYAG